MDGEQTKRELAHCSMHRTRATLGPHHMNTRANSAAAKSEHPRIRTSFDLYVSSCGTCVHLCVTGTETCVGVTSGEVRVFHSKPSHRPDTRAPSGARAGLRQLGSEVLRGRQRRPTSDRVPRSRRSTKSAELGGALCGHTSVHLIAYPRAAPVLERPISRCVEQEKCAGGCARQAQEGGD